jgi:hypothetical protein
MTSVSITSIILDKFKYNYNADIRANIFDYRNLHNIGSKGTLTQYKNCINFKSQIGGETYEIKLDDNLKYEFYMDEIVPETNDLRRMCFMSNSYSYECLCVMFGTKKSGDTTMIIESVMNGDDCVKCENNTKKIKAGDTLMQILLKILETNSKFSHIKKIKLSDTSKKSCYDIGIKLVYLRTITHGIPYYAKFGFRPEMQNDYQILKNNRENYKLNKTIINTHFLKIIEMSKVNMKKNTFDTYKKYFEKYILENKDIDPKLFFTEIIDIIDISIGKKEMTKDNIFIGNKIIKKKNVMESICDFLNSICKNVFLNMGYEDYFNNIWIMKI